VIGCGNIGSIVADARSSAHESGRVRSVPVAGARKDIGVEKVDLETCSSARFHHLAHPADRENEKHHRRGGTGEDEKGRAPYQLRTGGLVDEQALVRAEFRHVAGAAFDVFVESRPPPTCCRHPNVICTPHLGAATTEAQENVALQWPSNVDYLLTGRFPTP